MLQPRFTATLLSSVVAVAEDPKDPMRQVCLTSLRNLAVRDVAVLAAHNALPTLLHAVVPEIENGQPIAELSAIPLVYTFAHLIDQPQTRCYLHTGAFLQKLLSPLTELEDETPERRPQMQLAQTSAAALGGTWAVCSLSAGAARDARAAAGAADPSLAAGAPDPRRARDAAAAAAPQEDAVLDDRPLARACPAPVAPRGDGAAAASLPAETDLLQAYSVVVLQVLLHCGLPSMLEAAGRSTDRNLAWRAGALRELLVLAASDRLRPARQRPQLHQLGTLTTHAMRLRIGT